MQVLAGTRKKDTFVFNLVSETCVYCVNVSKNKKT